MLSIERFGSFLRQLEQRLALNDGKIVGERVKCLHKHAAIACFDIDVANGPQRHAATRVKCMQQAPALPVLGKFLLEGPEHFGRDRFQLKAHVICRAIAAFKKVVVLTAQPMGKKLPLLGQRILRRGSHFGQGKAAGSPCDDVPRGCDIDLGGISTTLDRARLKDLKKLRMQRPAIESKRQFGDFGSYGQHGDETPNVLQANNRTKQNE